MKIKCSDYVAAFLAERGIHRVFMVVGGGAMHLDDSFGREKSLKLTFNHHEQACAIAAESYARLSKEMACVCVTTGPGGINALTGVAGAYLDSIPMMVISGQVRLDNTVVSTGLPLRSLGDQEFDIVSAVKKMTKYAVMIKDASLIRYELEKAYYIAETGRKGPVWIDIPVNIQGTYIDTDKLESFFDNSSNFLQEVTYRNEKDIPSDCKCPLVSENDIDKVIEKIAGAKRPVLYAGNGIRLSGAHDIFIKVIDKLGVPIVTGWDSIDEIWNEHPLYVGRGGMMGDRAGNFAVENSDLCIAIGNRLSIRQVGYNWKNWAKNSFVIDVDVDRYELYKPTIHVEMPIWADAKDFLQKLDDRLDIYLKDKGKVFLYDSQTVVTDCAEGVKKRPDNWRDLCSFWKKEYPVVTDKHYAEIEKVNVYAFFNELGKALPQNQTIVVSNGSACVVGSQSFYIKKGQRFIINSAMASMGYGLPAAIGAFLADHKEGKNKSTVLITGDGSIQMNLQELQTIVTNDLDIKIFVINNDGYHSIRQTQTNLFEKNFVGIGKESGGLSFPELKKLAAAYGYPYFCCDNNKNLQDIISKTIETQGYAICEIMCSTDQFFEPKSATKKLDDGTLVSPGLDDLKPFLSSKEHLANMVITD